MTKPSTSRVSKLRQQRKDAGLVRLELWVTPEQAQEIKELLQDLKRERRI